MPAISSVFAARNVLATFTLVGHLSALLASPDHAWVESVSEPSEGLDPKNADGEYTTDGAAILNIAFSVGQGQGSARFMMRGDQFAEFAEILESFEIPSGTATTLPDQKTPAPGSVREVILNSMRWEDDDVLFTTKTGPNSKSTRLTPDFWDVLSEKLDAKLSGLEIAELLAGSRSPEKTTDEKRKGERTYLAELDTVRKSLDAGPDNVSFKLSSLPHTKAIKVARSEWKDFVGLIREMADTHIPEVVAEARAIFEAQERENAEQVTQVMAQDQAAKNRRRARRE